MCVVGRRPPVRGALALIVGVVADHLDGDVLHRLVDDHGVFETLVEQDLFQAHPASFGRLVQQGDAGLVVMRARGEDQDNKLSRIS